MDKVQEIMELVDDFKDAWTEFLSVDDDRMKSAEECVKKSFGEIESKLRALLEQQQKDLTDAECFRWWVHEAAANPALVAKAIAHCITEDEYRAVIVGAKVAKDAAIKAATKGA